MTLLAVCVKKKIMRVNKFIKQVSPNMCINVSWKHFRLGISAHPSEGVYRMFFLICCDICRVFALVSHCTQELINYTFCNEQHSSILY